MIALRPTSLCALVVLLFPIGCSEEHLPSPAKAESVARARGERPASTQEGMPRDAGTASLDAAPSAHDAAAVDDAGSAPQPGTDASAANDRADASSRDADAGTPSRAAPDAGVVDASSLEPGDLSATELLDWVLEVLTHGRVPTSAEIAEYFAPSFLQGVPEPQLVATFMQLIATLRPFTVAQREVTGPLAVMAQLDSPSGPYSVRLTASSSVPRQIVALWFQPATSTTPTAPVTATTYEQAIATLANLARDAQVLVAKVDERAAGHTCDPIAALDASRRLAIGSAFKLWVLLALDEKLASDPNLSWETTIPIRDNLKSLPSGVLQNQPAGTELTLDEYASKMISISDNTAADHLIEFVGRTAVENVQRVSGHSDPAANIPWYTTRELFVLKTSVSADELAAFQRASLAEKRTQLAMLGSRSIDIASLNSWSAPRLLDFEWFASPQDLCGVLATLGARAAFAPASQLLKILGLNSGIAFDGAQWSYVGFKGGSEPGVLNLSWLLQHASGAWFSVVVTLNDPAMSIDENAAVVAVASMMPLLLAEVSASSP